LELEAATARAASAAHNGRWLLECRLPRSCHKDLEHSLGFKQPSGLLSNEQAAAGVQIGGWHDFRHTLSRTLRRAGVHPVVIKDTLGHSKVDLAMNVYDKASAEDIRAGLRVVSKKLLGSDLLPKDLLPATPKQPEADESAA
jgi:integrase